MHQHILLVLHCKYINLSAALRSIDIWYSLWTVICTHVYEYHQLEMEHYHTSSDFCHKQ